jgi:WD40 repeat protein
MHPRAPHPIVRMYKTFRRRSHPSPNIATASMCPEQAFKATPTWLQLPFRANAQRWTVLHLNLDATLRAVTSRKFACIKGITLCANMLVRNVIVTDAVYTDPDDFPKEMRLFVSKDSAWLDEYELIHFPLGDHPATGDPAASTDAAPTASNHAGVRSGAMPAMSAKAAAVADSDRRHGNKTANPRVVVAETYTSVVDGPLGTDIGAVPHDVQHTFSVVRHSVPSHERTPTAVSPGGRGVAPASTLPAVGLDLSMLNPLTDHAARVRDHQTLKHATAANRDPKSPRRSRPAAPPRTLVRDAAPVDGGDGHARSGRTASPRSPRHMSGQSGHRRRERGIAREVPDAMNEDRKGKLARGAGGGGVVTASRDQPHSVEGASWPSVMADDRESMTLSSTIGFSSTAPGGVGWGAEKNSVVYACHRVIVLLDTVTRKQRLLLGHTAKVKAMAVDHTGGFLVSVQHGSRPALRVWNLQTLQCTSTLKTKEVEVHALALSTDGYTLATVGRCRQGKKQTVALWDAAAAHRGGKLVQVDRAQCDASIDRFAFALTDPHCMVSCGRDNIRVWRVRRNQLRSTPVNLASFHGENLQFTDVSFAAYHSPRHQALKALVSASGGQVFEVDIATIKIVKVHRLSDSPLRCLHASPTHTVTGGEDRMLRVWPLGFGESKMEAEHAGAVCCVQTSPDEAKVLVGTTAGSVGVLDLQSKQYSTVMRAHLEPLVAMAARPDSFDVVSLSTDGTIIVWSLRTHEELFDFQIPDGAEAILHLAALVSVSLSLSLFLFLFLFPRQLLCPTRHQHPFGMPLLSSRSGSVCAIPPAHKRVELWLYIGICSGL